MFSNALLIISLLRTFGKYAPLLQLVRETIAAVKAGDWALVSQKIEELLEKAGILNSGPVRFGGSVPLGVAGPVPADVEADLDALEDSCS